MTSVTPFTYYESAALAFFCAGISRGATGTGIMITIMLIWLVISSLGVDAGPFSLQVVMECLAEASIAVPQLFITQAHKNVTVEIVVSVMMFSALTAPIGAWLLFFMNVGVVELVMGLALLVALVISLELPRKAWRLIRGIGLDKTPCPPLGLMEEGAPGMKDLDEELNEAKPLLLPDQPITKPLLTDLDQPAPPDDASHTASDEIKMIRQQIVKSLRSFATSMKSTDGRREFFGNQRTRDSIKLLCWGSLAGAASGLMGGLAGMPGPPVIILYTILKIEKDKVRGNGSWFACTSSLRVFSYLSLGMLESNLWDLYLVAIAFHVCGLTVGNVASKHISQQVFSKFLLLLIVTCASLLLLSSAGVGGHHGGHNST